MDAVASLEKTVAGWYKNVPHLPKNAQQWLADNVWWIALISFILGVVGLFTLVPAALIAFGLSSSLSGVYALTITSSYYWVTVLVSLVSLLATTVLTALAITPLRNHARSGWNLLFLSLVVSVALSVVNSLLSLVLAFSSMLLGALVWSLFTAALSFLVGSYFLFEIRSHFGAKKKEAVKKAAAKS